MSKKLIGGVAAVLLLLTAPAWAHGGPPHGNAHGHWKNGKHWQKHHAHQHYGQPRYVVREVYRPVYPRAVYPVYPAPAPGIHVVVPNIFIPFH